MPEENKQNTRRTTAKTPRKKKRVGRLLIVFGPVAVCAVTAYLYWTGGRYVETDNAYVQADKVVISAEVSGTINTVRVAENSHVEQGEPLFDLDDRSYSIALNRAKANVQGVLADINSLKAEYKEKQNERKLAQVDQDYAAREYKRQAALADNRVVSQARLDEARHTLNVSKQKIGIIQDELAQILSKLEGDPKIKAERLASYRLAKAEEAQAALNLERTVVKAPFSGLVSKIPKPGQHVTPGGAVISLIADQRFWVEANFKETELTHVRPGQTVTIQVDTYPDEEWVGQVVSISPGTGSEFSVIPAQNATGNWVKVVQRIPVRVALTPNSRKNTLRAGMSTIVRIDTQYNRPLPAPIRWITDVFGLAAQTVLADQR